MKSRKIITLLLLLIACTSPQTKEDGSDEDLIKSKIATLKIKHPSALLWDSLKGSYSVDYYKAINSSNVIITNAQISDVYIKDSLHYILISADAEGADKFYFTLKVTEEQQQVLKKYNSFDDQLIFVAEIHSIKKVIINHGSDYALIEEDVIELNDTDEDFFALGKLIEFATFN